MERRRRQQGDGQDADNPAVLPAAPLRRNRGECEQFAPRSKRDTRAIGAIRGWETAQLNLGFPDRPSPPPFVRRRESRQFTRYAKTLQDIDNNQLTVT
jgi:hypothetical protein